MEENKEESKPKTDFEVYLEKYAKQRGITEEEAKKHITVRTVAEYYGEII